jgi:hypothetical protein
MSSKDFVSVDNKATLTSGSSSFDTEVKSTKAVQSSKQILSPQELNVLNAKSDIKGFLQLVGHLAVMSGSGYLWGANMTHLTTVPSIASITSGIIAIPKFLIKILN